MHDSEVTPTPSLEERLEFSLTEADPKVIDGRYTIVDRLGEGGMGKVYEAIDTVLQRHVAVKVLSFNHNNDEHIIKRFQQEARAISKLNHPGIIRALDFGLTEEQEPFLVMEYLNGETLDAMVNMHGCLTLHEFSSIFTQIIEAMIHAHSFGVIHRDLKPSNIMVCKTTEALKAYVFDFGIAKILEDSGSIVNTKTGLVVGSPRCISPEQVCGGALDSRSDVYSLGCVMFEALTGSPPFKGNNAMETMQMHVNAEPPRLRDANEEINFDGLEELIAKTLAKKPEHRFQSMSELLNVLKETVISLDTNDLEKDEVSKAPERKTAQKKSKSLLVFAAIIVIGIAMAMAVSKNSSIGRDMVNTGQFEKNSGKELFLVEEPRLMNNLKDKKLTNKIDPDLFNGFDESSDANADMYRQTIQKFVATTETNLKFVRGANNKALLQLDRLTLGNANLTPDDWRKISDCKNLQVLNLNSSSLTDQTLIDYVSKLTNLTNLDATGTSISPDGIKKAFANHDRSLRVKVLYCKQFDGKTLSDLSKVVGVQLYDF